jgi:hypothetical protein
MTTEALKQLLVEIVVAEPEYCNTYDFIGFIQRLGLDLAPRELGEAITASNVACHAKGDYSAKTAAYRQHLLKFFPDLD